MPATCSNIGPATSNIFWSFIFSEKGRYVYYLDQVDPGPLTGPTHSTAGGVSPGSSGCASWFLLVPSKNDRACSFYCSFRYHYQYY